ncbi:MAG: hypothetical protein KF824_09010 [Fimbriimonadaceae bacterium]|nr:MAG: hypothetical protein KF824_09010 [Fimbriimonadaceae bacterium]
MKRFLDGDNLPQEVLNDLEKHLRVCPTCQNVIDNEKVSLEEVLDGPAHAPSGIAAMMGKITGKAATPGGFVTAGPAEALLHASSRTYAPAAPGMAAFKNPKVLFLSGALALVLIAMSTILKNPSNLLGPKAAAVYGQTSEEKTTPAKDEHAEEPKDETSGDGSETTDPHANSTEHGAEETKPPEDTQKTDPHTTDSHSTTTDESGRVFVNDPRVPGKPTVDTSDLIVAGGKNSETEHKEPPKTTTAHKPAPKTQTPKKSSGSTKRKPSGSTAKKPSSGGGSGSGIKVYDPSGKPIG